MATLASRKRITDRSREVTLPDGSTLMGTAAAAYGKSEPAVLSSRAGASAFESKVQPVIDSANQVTAAARKATDARRATDLAQANGEQLPPDVLAELDQGLTEEERVDKAQNASWDRQIETAQKTYRALTLASKASAAAQIQALTGQWNARKELLRQSTRANVASWNQQFIRSGQAEYSPGMTSEFLTGKEQEGARAVQALDNDYNAAVASVNTAVEERNYERAATLTSTLSGIEDKMLTRMKENAKEAAAVNAKLQESLTQSSREMAISDIVKQGITDPAEIQDYLNNTEAGAQVGDISLKEISDVLKIVNPSEDLAGLSTDYRTFKYLKDNNDPTVKDMSYMGYLRAVENAQRAPKEPKEGDTYKFSQGQQSQLLGGGFTSSDIAALQTDITRNGLSAVLANPSLTKEQQDVIRRALAGSENAAQITAPAGEKFITSDYLAGLFTDTQLKKSADDEGYRHLLTSWGTEKQNYLDHLMQVVEQYRKADYSDQEILKMMQ